MTGRELVIISQRRGTWRGLFRVGRQSLSGKKGKHTVMSGKRRKAVLALAAAGTVGLSAPLASAHGSAHGHDTKVSSGVINVNNNQIPIQVCGNGVPGNALGGQVPVDDVLGQIGLGSDGGSAILDTGCKLKN